MNPNFKTFRKLAKNSALVPTFCELPADLDTPVTVYLKLSHHNPYGALLESVEVGEKLGRYSFISVSHHLKFECSGNDVAVTSFSKSSSFPFLSRGKHLRVHCANPLDELKNIFSHLRPVLLPELPRFCGGAIGMVGYDMVRNFETLPTRLDNDLKISDALFLFTDECVVFDHWKHKMILIKWNLIEKKNDSDLLKIYRQAENALERLKKQIQNHDIAVPTGKKNVGNTGESGIYSNFTKKEFMNCVSKIKDYIKAGDAIQVVMSQRFEMASDVDPLQVYRALRIVNPSPYLYFLRFDHFSIAGSSPEILVRKEGNMAMTRPIAGTRPRGKTALEDDKFEKELLNDPKEKAEHLMLVDLGRNDLGRCCKPGSIKVPEFMTVERYSHVMHLVSSVEGALRSGEDAFSLFKACFPAGTVTGAPKIRAMEIIEELEKVRRGIYAGSVGYFSYSGNMDMAITIRTILLKNRKVYMQAGAGIVADSVPGREEKETRSKAAALFRAVELAQKGL